MAAFFKWLVNLFKQPPAFLRDIHSRNKRLFRYVKQDNETDADYKVHKTAYLNNGPYSGDCDDFALTVAYFALEARNPNVRKVTWKLCRLEDGTAHVVVGVETLNGDIWISDNRAKALQLIGDITNYQWLYYKDAAQVVAAAKVL